MTRSLFRTGLASAALALVLTADGVATAQKSDKKKDKAAATPTPTPSPMIGGVVMRRTNTLAQNLTATPDMTTFMELATLSGLATKLAEPGPFTVLAPDNAAFATLPPTTLAALKQPENKGFLTQLMNYHVLEGQFDLPALKQMIVAGGGKASLNTLAGVPITFEVFPLQGGGETLLLTGAGGNKVYVSAADIHQANGIFHVINGVMSPLPPAPPPPPAAPTAPAAPQPGASPAATPSPVATPKP